MADQYAPPTGPPPPKVPPGWTAQYNEQYKEWFFVNLHTKKSQWEPPTSPARGPSEEPHHPSDQPPGYAGSNNPAFAPNTFDTKQKPLDSYSNNNNPYNSSGAGAAPPVENDAAMAARLQAEEDARGRGGHSPRPPADVHNPGANTDYYGQPMPPQHVQGGYPAGGIPPGQQQQYGSSDHSDPNSGNKSGGGGGLLGKLAGKLAGKSGGSSHGGYGHYGGGGGSYGGYPQQHGYGGGYPQHYGGGYGGYPHHQPQHGYGGGGMLGGHRPPPRKGGLGAGGAAALGVGGGLVGGMALANAMDGDDYNEGYQDGQQDDFGGDDMGDMGDMGGGDF